MKQILLRVPADLHARLTDQARTAGTSVNALANQILGLGIDPTSLSRRDRLKLKLVTIGTVGRNPPAGKTPAGMGSLLTEITPEEWAALRAQSTSTTQKTRSIADELIDYERDDR